MEKSVRLSPNPATRSQRCRKKEKKKKQTPSYLRSRWATPRRRGCRSGRTGARSRRVCTGTGRSPARTPWRRSPPGSSRTAGRCRCPRGGSGCPGDHVGAERERALIFIFISLSLRLSLSTHIHTLPPDGCDKPQLLIQQHLLRAEVLSPSSAPHSTTAIP